MLLGAQQAVDSKCGGEISRRSAQRDPISSKTDDFLTILNHPPASELLLFLHASSLLGANRIVCKVLPAHAVEVVIQRQPHGDRGALLGRFRRFRADQFAHVC